jgi:hypothetical protein
MKIPVPFGIKVSVEISRDIETDTATVIVHAPIYKTKRWELSQSYKSSQFSDYKIINDCDFIRVMRKHFPEDS